MGILYFILLCLSSSLSRISDVSYGYVIDQQPIGRILFRMFCENKRPLYYRYISFLDNVTRFVCLLKSVTLKYCMHCIPSLLFYCCSLHCLYKYCYKLKEKKRKEKQQQYIDWNSLCYRYELEYDENRSEIGWDIGRRFLGIECENNPVSDSRCSAEVVKDSEDVVLQIADNDAHNKCERRNSNDATTPKQETTNTTTVVTKPVSNTTNYSTTSSNKLSKENVNADAGNDDAVSKSSHANDNNKDDTSKETHLNNEKDELVLDVLNDDLIEKVRVKISCKSFSNV